MAKITLYMRDGTTRNYSGGTSVYKGYLYIWALGKRKGKKPIAKIPLNQIHSKKKTGRKGIYISKY